MHVNGGLALLGVLSRQDHVVMKALGPQSDCCWNDGSDQRFLHSGSYFATLKCLCCFHSLFSVARS